MTKATLQERIEFIGQPPKIGVRTLHATLTDAEIWMEGAYRAMQDASRSLAEETQKRKDAERGLVEEFRVRDGEKQQNAEILADHAQLAAYAERLKAVERAARKNMAQRTHPDASDSMIAQSDWELQQALDAVERAALATLAKHTSMGGAAAAEQKAGGREPAPSPTTPLGVGGHTKDCPIGAGTCPRCGQEVSP